MRSWLPALIAALLLGGCAAARSYDAELWGTLNQASAGNVDAAIRLLEANNAGPSKDLLYYLERGMLERLAGRFDESEKAWMAAESRIDAGDAGALQAGARAVRGASSYVVSDRLRVYDGHDYEKVMLLTYMALNHLARGDLESARVAIKQTHELEAVIERSRARELAEVEAEAKKRGARTSFKELNGYPVEVLDNPAVNALRNGYQSALSHYLAGFVYESLAEPSLAAPGYRLANELQPNQPALEEALRGLDERVGAPADGMTDVLFIVASGCAPALKAQTFALPVPVNGTAVMVPFSFPLLVPDPSSEAPGALVIGGAQRVALTTITSVDLMARRSLKDDMPAIMLRAAVRSMASAVLQYQAQQHSRQDAGPAIALAAVALAGIAQAADERTWRTLPAQISIARVRLPPGAHDVVLETAYGPREARVNVAGRYAVLDFRVLSRQLFIQAPAAGPTLHREALQ